MASKNDDGFDVLTFYIYVMALLTAIVGGFALWNRQKVNDQVRLTKAEVIKLDQMKQLAIDDDMRAWVARERTSAVNGPSGSPADFQALCRARANENGVNIASQQSQGTRNLPDGTELTYRLTIDQVRVESLVKFLVRVEEDWPGARVKQIVKLDWNERKEAWDSVIELSIFRAAAGA